MKVQLLQLLTLTLGLLLFSGCGTPPQLGGKRIYSVKDMQGLHTAAADDTLRLTKFVLILDENGTGLWFTSYLDRQENKHTYLKYDAHLVSTSKGLIIDVKNPKTIGGIPLWTWGFSTPIAKVPDSNVWYPDSGRFHLMGDVIFKTQPAPNSITDQEAMNLLDTLIATPKATKSVQTAKFLGGASEALELTRDTLVTAEGGSAGNIRRAQPGGARGSYPSPENEIFKTSGGKLSEEPVTDELMKYYSDGLAYDICLVQIIPENLNPSGITAFMIYRGLNKDTAIQIMKSAWQYRAQGKTVDPVIGATDRKFAWRSTRVRQPGSIVIGLEKVDETHMGNPPAGYVAYENSTLFHQAQNALIQENGITP